MTQTPDQIVQRMIATLNTTLPGLDCGLGTPERKILDVVGEAISEASVAQYLVGSLLDVDTKTGAELDQFVGIFGFGRLQGNPATGTVRITANIASTSDTTFQQSTQFYTTPGLAGIPTQLYYASTQAVVLTAGNKTCDIPVQCTTVGSAGNVPPDSVTFAGTSIGGSNCTNLAAMTGGVDVETDAELRQRFKDTLLRNIAGQADWYEALCQQNSNVSRVVVYGPLSLYQTQISVPSTTLVLPVNQDVKYAWCLTPNTRILNAALDWVPVGSLRVGDSIIGFDEHLKPGRGQKRKWQPSVVTGTSIYPAKTLSITFDVGSSVTSTPDHMWLVSKRQVGHSGKKRGVVRSSQGVQWVKTKDLFPGDVIRYIPPWDEDVSFEAGWMSGFTDGEGSYNQHNLTLYQNDGPVLDHVLDILDKNKFKYRLTKSTGGLSQFPEKVNVVGLRGGIEERLRFFGLFKPARLMGKFLNSLYGSSIVGKDSTFATVVSVEPAGTQDIVALSTSTETLVAEGLLSHNTNMESVFTDLGQESEVFYSSVNDYVYTGGTSPTFQTISTGALTPGNVVDLEFQYTTRSSRNDPLNGITNKVDVFVDGVNPYAITEQSVISATTLSSTSTNPLYTGNFERVGSGGTPVATNRFMRLGSTPIVSFPSTLTIGGVVYTQGEHYFLLQDTTLMRGTQLETSGLEWTSAGPPTGTEVTLNYVYNQVPEVLNALVASSKQITTDVLVHQGQFAYIQSCLQIEYDRTFSPATVNSAITARLQQYFSSLPFGAQVKLSTITMFVQQTQGVVDVKVTTSAENSVNYGIQLFDNSADTVPAVVETDDFKLSDNQLAVYQGVLITRVATP